MVFLACTCFLSQVLEFTYFFPLIPKAGGPDCFAEPQIQAEQSGRSLYACFLRFNLSYPNFYYSFSFSALQSINLSMFTMMVWLCPRSQSSDVASHPSHVYFVILFSLKGWSKSHWDSWSIDMCCYKLVWASHIRDANTSTNTLQRGWWAWWWFPCPRSSGECVLTVHPFFSYNPHLAFDVSLNCSIPIFWDNLPFKGVEFQVGNSLAQYWWENHLHCLSWIQLAKHNYPMRVLDQLPC